MRGARDGKGRTGFVKDDGVEPVRVLEEREEDAELWDGIVGTTWWDLGYERPCYRGASG